MIIYTLSLKQIIKAVKEDPTNRWINIIAYQNEGKLEFLLELRENVKLLSGDVNQVIYRCNLQTTTTERLPKFCELSFGLSTSYFHLIDNLNKYEFIASLNDHNGLKDGYKVKTLCVYDGDFLAIMQNSITNNF